MLAPLLLGGLLGIRALFLPRGSVGDKPAVVPTGSVGINAEFDAGGLVGINAAPLKNARAADGEIAMDAPGAVFL